jgi:hypothetical protein
MKRTNCLVSGHLAGCLFVLAGLVTPAIAATPSAASQPLVASYGKLPLSFVANQGQADRRVRFMARGAGYSLALTDSEALLALAKRGRASGPDQPPQPASVEYVHMRLNGAQPSPRIGGEEKLPGVSNYILGNDPAQWHTGVENFAKVRYAGVYPGVDLVYYGNQSQLEFDFVVAPGASSRAIRLGFTGGRLKLDANGNLSVAALNGQVTFHKPVIYQMIDGRRRTVEGSFALLDHHTVGFNLGAYDHALPLVIDPVLVYGTYLGSTGSDAANSIKVDATGNAYLTGYTNSPNFPVLNPYQSTNGGTNQQYGTAFVSKLNPTGTALVYSTFLGGKAGSNNGDYGSDLAFDSEGDVYVTGGTGSASFPVTAGAYQATNKAASSYGYNGFLSVLDPTGSKLLYSTFIGGSTRDSNANGPGPTDAAVGMALDENDTTGNIYVFLLGNGNTADFPTTSGAYQTKSNAVANGADNAWICEFNFSQNPAGVSLKYSTRLGGSVRDDGYGIAIAGVSGSMNAYIAGTAHSPDFPTTAGAYQTKLKSTAQGDSAAFVTELNSTGSALVYSTYLGGSGSKSPGGLYGDWAYGIALDSAGNAYISGETGSTDFPITAGALQTVNIDFNADAPGTGFVTKLNPTGTALVYSTYLGGGGDAIPSRIAVDSIGRAYVTGQVDGGWAFPVTPDAFNSGPTAGQDPYATSYSAFVVKLNTDGTALKYGTLFPPSGNFGGNGIFVDSNDNIYFAGYTDVNTFPISTGAFQATNKTTTKYSGSNAYIAELDVSADTNSYHGTTTAIAGSATLALPTQSVTFNTTVTANNGGETPTGSVVFSWNSTACGQDQWCYSPSVPLVSGKASYSTAVPAPQLQTQVFATYSGDDNYLASVGAYNLMVVQPQTINVQSFPVTFGHAPLNLSLYDWSSSQLPLTYTVASGPGTIGGSTLTITGAGTIEITVSQPGNADYFAAAPVTQTITVAKAPQTIGFTPPATINYGTTAVNLAPDASATSGLPVSFTVLSGPLTASGTTVTPTGTGDAVVQATQPGNANYLAATAVSATIDVLPAPQTIAFNPPPSVTYGVAPYSIASYATASSGLAVTFTVVSGPATISGTTITITGGGPVVIQAAQAGNADYLAAPSVQQTLTVLPEPQSITFTPPATVGIGAPINLASYASDTSGLPIVFTVVSGPGSISGTTLTASGAGTVVVQASQAGNVSWQPATPVKGSMIAEQPQTITFTPPTSEVYGNAPINLASYAKSTSGLTVAFTLVSGPGSLTGTSLSFTGVGSVVVTASQPGNSTYGAANPVTVTIVVAQASQNLTFTPPASAGFVAGPINLSTYTTIGSGLPVTYTLVSGPATLNGYALTLTGLGVVSLKATQAGNADYLPASVSATIDVTIGSQTIAFNAPSQVSYGGPPINLASLATASSGLPVSLTLVSGPATLTAGMLTVTGTGSVVVKATQAGNADFSAAPAVTATIQVVGEAQTITSTLPASIPYTYLPINLATYVTASSGLPVSFSVTSGSSVIKSGTTLALGGLGKVVLQATQAGNGNFTAAPALAITTTVVQGTQTIAFTPPASVNYGTASINLTTYATDSQALTVAYKVVSGPGTIASGAGTLTITGVGNVVVQASQAGNSLVAAATPVQATIVVNPEPQTITLTQPITGIWGQGVPLAADAKATSGLPVTFKVISGPATIVGTTLDPTASGTVTIEADQAGNATWAPAPPVQGTVTIAGEGQNITFTPPATATYGVAPINLASTAHASSNLPVSFSVQSGPGSISGTTLTITGAGNIVLVASQPGNADYAAANQQKSTLLVSPASLTITANNASVAYNQPLPTFTFTPTGFVNADTAAVLSGTPAYSTKATVGSLPGTFPITITAGTLKAANYTFTFVNGTLTVTTAGPAATPVFGKATGSYPGALTETITCTTAGSKIYYTTNGTAPTTSSTQYTESFQVRATETINAIAVAPGYAQSAEATAVLTIQ